MNEDNIENLEKVGIVFVGGFSTKYYFDKSKESLGSFMKDGWGHFYNPEDKRWEFINMQRIEKIYYDREKITTPCENIHE
jgi:hypothetical protein